MTVEQRRAVWRAVKNKRMQNTESKQKVYAAHKKWFDSEKGLKYKKAYREKAAMNMRKYRKQKPYTPVQRVVNSMRARMCSILRGKCTEKTVKRFVGCTVEEFRRHLESTFTAGMTWDNYGTGFNERKEWNVDHVIPISRFNCEDIEDVRKALHWTNTAARWAVDNYKKGNRDFANCDAKAA